MGFLLMVGNHTPSGMMYQKSRVPCLDFGKFAGHLKLQSFVESCPPKLVNDNRCHVFSHLESRYIIT